VNEVVLLCERSEPLVAFKKRWSCGVFVSEESSVSPAFSKAVGAACLESGGKFRKSCRADEKGGESAAGSFASSG
jgi:hypothetical protein